MSQQILDDRRPPWRLPAGDLEPIVLDLVARVSSDLAQHGTRSASDHSLLLQHVSTFKCRLQSSSASEQRRMLGAIDTQVIVAEGEVSISVNTNVLQQEVLGTDAPLFDALKGEERLTTSAAVALRKRGREVKLVLASAEQTSGHADQKLVALLAKGFAAREQLMRRPEEVGVKERPYATRLARLSYLAPDIVESILDGRQPIELTARRLLREAQLPLCWEAQRQQLGYATRR